MVPSINETRQVTPVHVAETVSLGATATIGLSNDTINVTYTTTPAQTADDYLGSCIVPSIISCHNSSVHKQCRRVNNQRSTGAIQLFVHNTWCEYNVTYIPVDRQLHPGSA